MKRFSYFCIVLMLSVCLLSGCGKSKSGTFIADSTEYDYVMDREAQTITLNADQVYGYEVQDGYVMFTYPDGGTVLLSGDEFSAGISADNLSENEEYNMDPYDLFSIYWEGQKSSFSWIGIVPFLIGLFLLIFPDFFWKIPYGWIFKVEKGPAALWITRIEGIVCMILGLIWFFYQDC